MSTRSTVRHLIALLGLAQAVSVCAAPTQSPLFLSGIATPNIMLMLDNSGSMLNVVPASSYDPNITYNCTGATVWPAATQVDIRITAAGVPYLNQAGTDRDWGTGGGNGATNRVKRCFDAATTYKARLYGDSGAANATKSPGNYLPSEYTGNFLNWYFGTNAANVYGAQASGFGNQARIKPGSHNRMMIAQSAAKTLVNSMSGVRVGLSTYNSGNGGQLLESVGTLNAAKKTAMTTAIDGLSASGNTPIAETLADIGFYFSRGATNLTLHPGTAAASTASRADVFASNTGIGGYNRHASWGNGDNPIQYSCQKSFAVLMTDGRPQGDRAISSYLRDYSGDCAAGLCNATPANTDTSDSCPLVDWMAKQNGTRQGRCYESGGSDYLDDVAMALRDIDLRPDLVDPAGAKNNVTTYLISFADDQAINDPLMQDTATRGGGLFLSAGDETTLVNAFQSTTQHILSSISSASSIATNSTRLDTETLVFQARFNSADWSGQLLAFPIDLGGTIGAAVWNTDNGIVPASGSRSIKTFNGSTGVDLAWVNLTCAQKGYLTVGDDVSVATNCANDATFYDGSVTGQNRVNWLNATNAATAFAGLRTRSKLLGDIVNSDPVFVYRELFAPFVSLTAPVTPNAFLPVSLRPWSTTLDSSYSAFHFLTKTNRTPMIYVGANDGMVHGFKATSSAADSGKELVAYVPNAIIPHISKLSDPNYGDSVPHRYFVDGALSTGDACIGTPALPATKDTCNLPTNWRSVLVGSLGAGGKAVFALDVTNPPNVTVLWEKDASMAGWEDLGYLVGEPQIALMRVNGTGNVNNDYKWVAVFGNGYHSSTGKAVLYIVDLLTGAQLQKIQVAAGPNNGLGPAAVFGLARSWFIGATNPTGTDSTGDSIYVADISGKVYRYGANATTGMWEQRYVLFDAGRPITGPIRLGAPKAGDRGVMVFFGTGKYFDAADTTDLAVQSLYGIWDELGGDTPYPRTRALLQQQTIDHELTVSGKTVRVTSNHQFSYTPGTGNNPKGWYMDLVFPAGSPLGERVVTRPLLRQDRVIFTTIVPSTAPCTYGGTSWIMELDALTGARLAYSAFDINDDRVMNMEDFVEITVNGDVIKVPVSAIKIESGMIKPAAVIARGGVEYKIVSTTSGEIASIIEKRGARPGVVPRTSWCEIGSGC